MKLVKILSDKVQIRSDYKEFDDVRINDLIAVSDGETLMLTIRLLSSRNLPDMETADIKDIEYFRREWVIAFADLWWQLEQHLECWCVQREPEQSTFQLEHEHRLPLRSTLRCQNRKLQGLPTVRGDKGTCFHSG